MVALMSLLRPAALRDRMETFLQERLDSEVELRDFGASRLQPGAVDGGGLVLRRHGVSGPPLLEIDRFDAHATPLGLFRNPRRVRRVTLAGVILRIAPGLSAGEEADRTDWSSTPAVIGELLVERARLELESKDPGKAPRIFEIHEARFEHASLEAPTAFRAELTIPTPRGRVEARGEIGAWNRRDPGQTRIGGEYRFSNADLGVFKGISGTLTSRGRFTGPLERVEVRGSTSTPNFALTSAGNPVPLDTDFDAVVDGTSGDTLLNVVRARLGESEIVTKGRVVRARDVAGRLIRLDVIVDRARLEDLLRLAIKGPKPPMSGVTRLRARMALSPGDSDVIDRLRLDGEFEVASARFADFDVQRAVSTLSQRGRGLAAAEAPPGERVASNLAGTFSLADGRMRFTKISFDVPGAQVRLAGDYHLKSEALNFQGVLVMRAPLADMTTGWKSALARLGDLWFRRGGETVLPIRVGGTRNKPQFGLDKKRAVLRKSEW